jgi:hypothetical protein
LLSKNGGQIVKRLIILLALLIFPTLSLAEEKVVIRFMHPDKVILSEFLTDNYDIAAYKPGLYLDLVVSTSTYQDLVRRGYDAQVTQTEKQLRSNLTTRTPDKLFGYRDYEDLLSELQQIESIYPNLCKLYDIGESWGKHYSENGNPYYDDYYHEIWALKVSDNVETEEDEPSVYYMGVHHAREPISLEVTMAVLHNLLQNYGTDPTITANVNNTQIWFIPLVNPNGHRIVTEQIDTWWRKNIRDNNNNGLFGSCDGVDPNRNYGFKWGLVGASDWECSEVYHGPYPWSEPEIQAIKSLLESHHFVAGISYHSYGELVLFPYGHNMHTYAPDHGALQDLAVEIAATIPAEHGGNYTPQEMWRLYPAMGTTDDYAYGEHGIFAFTIELGTEFIPPAYKIDTISNDNLQAAMILLDRINYSTLTGNIIDAETLLPVVAEVFIEGIDDTGDFRYPYTSDEEFGRYYRLLQPGSYTVTFYADGYEKVSFENVEITRDGQTNLNVTLNPTPLFVSLAPDDCIIERGTTLSYTATIGNRTNSKRCFSYWTNVTLPGGKKYPSSGELLGPYQVCLKPNESRSKAFSHTTPLSAPRGIYTYNSFIGPYPNIWTEGRFNFEITETLVTDGFVD